MSCQSIPEQTQKALQATSAQDSDTFVFTRGQQLYGITFSGIQSSLGVTGQIKSVGTGVALLTQPTSKINYVSTLSGHGGVTVLTAPDGGVVVKTKRLVAGAGITLTEGADTITISVA